MSHPIDPAYRERVIARLREQGTATTDDLRRASPYYPPLGTMRELDELLTVLLRSGVIEAAGAKTWRLAAPGSVEFTTSSVFDGAVVSPTGSR